MKKKNLKKTQKLKIMAALLSGGMLAVLSPNAAYALEGTAENNYTVTITDENITENVYGNKGNPDSETGDITGHVKISGGTIGSSENSVEIYGGYYYNGIGEYRVKNSVVEISGGTIYGDIYGGRGYYSRSSGWNDIRDAVDNKIYITGGTIYGDIYGGYDGSYVDYKKYPEEYKNHKGVARNEVWLAGGTIEGSVTAGRYNNYYANGTNCPIQFNNIYLTGDADVSKAVLRGSPMIGGRVETGNNLIVDDWNGIEVENIEKFHSIIFENIDLNKGMLLEVKDPITRGNFLTGPNGSTKIYVNSVKGGDYEEGLLNKTIQWDDEMNLEHRFSSIDEAFAVVISDDLKKGITGYYYGNRENNGIFINHFTNLKADDSISEDSQIEFTGTVDKTVLAGAYFDENGEKHGNTNNTSWDTSDDITYLTIENGLTTNASVVTGVYAVGGQTASDGKTYITGNYDGTVYAGYAEDNGLTENNYIYIGNGVNADSTKLLGNNKTSGNSGATLEVSGNGNKLNSIGRFDDIDFNNVTLNGDTVLKVIDADLDGTKVNVKTLAKGTVYHEGDKVTLLNSQNAITGNVENIGVNDDIVQAGVAQELTVSASKSDANNIDLTVTSVKLSEQTNLVAETRAASVGLLNQGTDLIADSINTISRDGKYGVKTFAAVYGNRSKYDVADDVKINGWSTIVGVGAENEHNGGDFSWGVFYENGSGNYRTYNGFDNELFRGDGSIVYNGGGIAARYENSHGVYTEGSLRAGMLKNEADNALFCGETGYGYETESAYYGAHIGVGKIWQLGDNSELDVYGKFFHTYVEGDTVHIAQDEFDLDSINSDRLRIGARITNNKENKFSTYYGLAYEYEFNGDADMRAAGMKAPTRSLQGSSYMAEVGFNYQPTPESPWSFDLNMRGYAGEREGATFNVQATYTF